MSKLTIALSKCDNLIDIEYYLNICDKLHNGEKVKGYTINDLPPDSIYEEYKSKIQSNSDNKAEKGVIMYMGSIPKDKEIKVIKEAFIMPKFDGCSVALRFQLINNIGILVKAHTRGSDVGSSRDNSDLTEKMQLLIPKIYFNPNSKLIKKFFSIMPEYINIRGEIVLKNKELDENGFNITAPASEVAGKINGGIEVFKNYLHKLRICAFEISSINLINDGINIPKQDLSLRMLNNIYYLEPVSNESTLSDISTDNLNENKKIYLKDYKVYIGDTNSINFPELFEKIKEEDPRPLDGLVYCSRDWKYPNNLEDTTATRYGKYAWKPSDQYVVNIKTIEYSMARNGEYSPMILYDKIKLDKSYERAKTSISRLKELIDEGIGLNAKGLLKICGGISPNIMSITLPSTEVFKLPEECLWCRSELSYEYDKHNKLMHIICTNDNCPEMILQKYSYLLNFMYKTSKLITLNDKGVIIKSKLSEQNLRKMSIGNLSIELIETRIPNLRKEFYKLSLVDQLCALSFGQQKKVEKMIQNEHITSLNDIRDKLWCDI